MTLPSVADIIAMPEVQSGRPQVLAGHSKLDKRVRWAHVSELEDISSLLKGGELILTTGIALPENGSELRHYIEALAVAEASGLFIETGRRFATVPEAMIRACARTGLPLVELRREVRFVHLTEAVHSRIVQHQFDALSLSARAHETFTALCIEGASVAEIVHETAKMIGSPVVYEDLMHRVLAYSALDVATEDLLANWTNRSRSIRTHGRPAEGDSEGWSVTSVEAHGQTFGRLIVVPSESVTNEQQMVVERAATALTLNRLLARNTDELENRVQRSILTDILEHRYLNERDMHARTQAFGVPTTRKILIAAVIHKVPGQQAVPARGTARTARTIAAQLRTKGIKSLVAPSPDGNIDVMITLNTAEEKERVLALAASVIHVNLPDDHLIGVGTFVRSLGELARSFAEARHVTLAARALDGQRDYFEMPDVQLRGLLFTLADDPRLQAFVERMLAPLLDHDNRHGTDLGSTLEVYLAHRGNKSSAAAAAHISRPAFYQRLASIERTLAVDLESADVCTSLHAALMALNATWRTTR
ncbi:PucR family transcriptional regulator ligand-binding domain-containing protein [Rhodococcus sp. B10]|uniref:PucR family transcriptional regulator n=1 Tax=Rhodococcus sp. B10 TaxID=2695876 RepID=UPI0014318F8C|nr:PucR family transcriptional regulator ligand-binding domain-containing protein [Rhodococcus sp. B10]NIL78365.1 hypothetical protein [Rhodococcus sp. B10]